LIGCRTLSTGDQRLSLLTLLSAPFCKL